MTTTSVADIMTEPVLTVEPDERPSDIATALLEADIKSVVVIDDACRPVGIFTSTDYVEMTALGVDPYGTTVEDQMTGDIVTTTPAADVTTAAATMGEHGIAHLPVVDDDGEVIGICSSTDLAEHLAEQE